MSSFKVTSTIALLALGGWLWFQRDNQIPQSFMAFLDVGQGDATYIRTTTGADVFIDGGPDRTILERVPEVMWPFDTTIETLILTHPDADHITGIVELVKRYDVQQIITTVLPATKPLHRELLQLIEDKHIQHVMVSAGDTLQLDPITACLVLYPTLTTPITQLETNDTSLILECHFAATSVLFTGDMSGDVESQLVGAIHELPQRSDVKQNDTIHELPILSDVDILKVPHHGSKSASTAEFLAAITPELCIIEVGRDNQYGHPHQAVMDRLQQHCQIRRTDQEGTIIIPLSQ